jgi:hypothetical protein
MNLQKKYLRRFSQYICAITDIEVQQDCPKLRPTRICAVKLEKARKTNRSMYSLSKEFMTYIALKVARFSSKKESSKVINLEDN